MRFADMIAFASIVIILLLPIAGMLAAIHREPSPDEHWEETARLFGWRQ